MAPPQGPYLNGVAELSTGLTPLELLSRLKSVERELGRQPSPVMNAPRPMDLDILLYDQIEFDSPELQIPHPRMHQRVFVMEPLSELLPEYAKKGCRP